MGSELRILRLGRLIARGDDLAFEPESDTSFVVAPGESFEIGVRYAYEETSSQREDFRLRLSFAFGGRPVGEVEHRIVDHPLVNDDEWGFLAETLSAPAKGPVAGTFAVDAEYRVGPWSESVRSTQEKARFHHRGTFKLDVREGTRR